ncbi:uncharacterized protein LOC108668919 [Hyalella azteca]|uniref:Uncharacterized protein LOC108668919 n=1 Tax=Hyalella azteca TaxID=294128 RepID=A0A8B7NDJ3_HYAAZ|nr:uncharacterized protein LOC108668919 [Hyalella azteca]XP_018011668.1 uncharacterized protein LOC108668919 [Hyalella azteca]XP_047736378.1 uncharacterized protein LOC108668919 [Hyalella azteca]
MATQTKSRDEVVELEIESIGSKYKFSKKLRGNWMMFFSKEYMNDMWAKAKDLYRAGQLHGIISLKMSTTTRVRNTADAQLTYGAIHYCCGPHTNRVLVLEYGKDLVKKMQYFCNTSGFIGYNAEDQSKIKKKTPRAREQYLYRLPVPTYDHLEQRSVVCSEPPIEVPSQVLTREWVTEVVGDFIKEPADFDQYCTWMMYFPRGTPHDSAWVSACRLYRAGELFDVAYISTSTAKPLPDKKNDADGVVRFYCRDNIPTSQLEQCGKNLINKLNYSAKFGSLCCYSYQAFLNRRVRVVLCRVLRSSVSFK